MINKIFSKEYLFSTGDKLQFWYIYLAFFVVLILAAASVRFVLKRRPDYEAKKPFIKQFYWVYLIFGLLGLISTFVRYENLPFFSARIITFVVIKLFFLLNVWLVYYYFTKTKKEILRLKDVKRKEKWLKKK